MRNSVRRPAGVNAAKRTKCLAPNQNRLKLKTSRAVSASLYVWFHGKAQIVSYRIKTTSNTWLLAEKALYFFTALLTGSVPCFMNAPAFFFLLLLRHSGFKYFSKVFLSRSARIAVNRYVYRGSFCKLRYVLPFDVYLRKRWYR